MRRSRVVLVVFSVAAVILLAFGAAGPLMSQVEQPNYKVVRSEGSIEIRDYPSIVVAQVKVRGDRKPAISDGFRIIAGYIFGANAGSEKIAMTAPVMQEAATGSTTGRRSDKEWTVRFVMPRSWPIDKLPKPRDPRVDLQVKPAATFAAIRFSGLASDKAVAEKTRELSSFIARSKLQPVGEPILAFFNPPWKLPFMRRNEVMIEVKQS